MRLGVDFGTAHTAAYLARAGREPQVLLIDGSPLMPSAVCVSGDGRLVAGRDAVHLALADPGAFEPYPKRSVDQPTVLLGGREITRAELFGAVLRRVVAEASAVTGEPVTEAVLTHPASWGAARRGALLDAAEGVLPSVRLMPEPVAAARHFTAVDGDLAPGRAVLVYDFGAGTFDATVLRRTPEGFDLEATEGLADCGGVDLDAAIVESLAVELRDSAGWAALDAPETAAHRRARWAFWQNVRVAKEVLSRSPSTVVHVPLIETEAPLGRETVARLAQPLIDRTVDACRAALRTAGVTHGELAVIYLTGGSSRLPGVASTLERTLGVTPVVIDQPELAVAQGSLRPDPEKTISQAFQGTTEAAGRALPSTRRPRRRTVVLAAAGVFLLLLGIGLIPLLGNGNRNDDGLTQSGPSVTPVVESSPAPSPTPSYAEGVDPCLVGTWDGSAGRRDLTISGNKTQFRSTNMQTSTFGPDGVLTVTFNKRAFTATVNGVQWSEITDGVAVMRYRAGNGTIIYSTPTKVEGTVRLYEGSRLDVKRDLEMSLEPETYVCLPTSLSTGSSFYATEFTRRVEGGS